MIDDIIKDAEERMQKSITSLEESLKKIRTGRAHPSILDSIMVSYYGSDTLLSQVANVSVEEGRNLIISPWEKNIICLLYTSPSPRDRTRSRMPSSA